MTKSKPSLCCATESSSPATGGQGSASTLRAAAMPGFPPFAEWSLLRRLIEADQSSDLSRQHRSRTAVVVASTLIDKAFPSAPVFRCQAWPPYPPSEGCILPGHVGGCHTQLVPGLVIRRPHGRRRRHELVRPTSLAARPIGTNRLPAHGAPRPDAKRFRRAKPYPPEHRADRHGRRGPGDACRDVEDQRPCSRSRGQPLPTTSSHTHSAARHAPRSFAANTLTTTTSKAISGPAAASKSSDRSASRRRR